MAASSTLFRFSPFQFSFNKTSHLSSAFSTPWFLPSIAPVQFRNSFSCSTFTSTKFNKLRRLKRRSLALCYKIKSTVHISFTTSRGPCVRPNGFCKGESSFSKLRASSEDNSLVDADERPMRKVVEHVVLFQMHEGFTESQEKDMLDHIYTLQYQVRGILAISLGCLTTPNPASCTHALFMRFPSREHLLQYFDHPARLKVAGEFIIPYCKGLIVANYESFVKSDIGPLFRRGEEFEFGIEYILLFEVKNSIDSGTIESVFHALAHLQQELRQLVVQLTAGINFSSQNQGYTHGLVARFPSGEAFDAFKSHPAYVSIVAKKILPISNRMLSVFYHVDPVGTTIT